MAKQKATLNEIIAKLEDDEAVGKVVEKHQNARSSYKLPGTKVKSYQEAVDGLMGYIKHHKKSVDKTEISDHAARTEAHDMLVAYGRQVLQNRDAKDEEAIIAAVNNIKRGKFIDLLDFYKTLQVQHDENTYSRSVILQSIDPLDMGHKAAIAKDYLAAHSGLFGKDELKKLTALSPDALANRVEDLLSYHRSARDRYKNVGTTHN